jgi:hypothetical protein
MVEKIKHNPVAKTNKIVQAEVKHKGTIKSRYITLHGKRFQKKETGPTNKSMTE